MAKQRYVSDTLKNKKKKVKKVKFYIFFFIFVLLISGIIYLLQIPQVQISEVKISGNSFVSTEEIQNKVDKELNSKILWFIPKSNILFFSKNKVRNAIKENPAIIDVSIHKDYFKTARVEVIEQEKEAIYCDSIERIRCYYVNKDGFIYAVIQDFIVPEQEIILYREADQKMIGDVVYEKDLHTSIMTFIKSSVRYGILIPRVQLKTDDVLEFYTEQGVILRASRYDDFEKDFTNFIALFEQDVLDKDMLSEIEYIDLRFGNKVFYKNKIN